MSPRVVPTTVRSDQIFVRSSFVNDVPTLPADELFSRVVQGVEGYEFTGTALTQSYALPATPTLATIASFAPTLPNTPLLRNPLRAINGSDVLVVRYVAEPLARVASSNYAVNAVTLAGTGAGERNAGVDLAIAVPSGSIFALSDCRRGRVFQGTRAGNVITAFAPGASTPGNVLDLPSPPGSGRVFGNSDIYGDSGQVGRLETLVYYVGVGTRGLPTLFRARYTFSDAGVATYVHDELVEGVESMQIMYGVPRMEGVQRGPGAPVLSYTEQAQNFVTAAQLAENSVATNAIFNDNVYITSATAAISARARLLRYLHIRSIRIALLIRSPEGVRVDLDERVYRLFGARADNASSVRIDPPNDRALRETYETTIQLRNQSFALH
jgi:type IV pilus assembly protein PilW